MPLSLIEEAACVPHFYRIRMETVVKGYKLTLSKKKMEKQFDYHPTLTLLSEMTRRGRRQSSDHLIFKDCFLAGFGTFCHRRRTDSRGPFEAPGPSSSFHSRAV